MVAPPSTSATRDEPRAVLPSLVGMWLSELLGGDIPAETNATCSDCAMCRPPDRMVTGHAAAFRPDTKCCTFVPHLPNFAVGQILKDTSAETAEGRATVERRVSEGIGVTPLGLDPSEVYQLLYVQSKDKAFGRSLALRCPHYIDRDGGLCGIWRYRNATCATYHCKFVRGARGRRFWDRLRQVLHEVETGLERWCVDELGIGDSAIAALIKPASEAKKSNGQLAASSVDGRVDEQEHRRLWGSTWIHREGEFYVAAADLVERLSWTDVAAICGIRLRLLVRILRAAYAALHQVDTPTVLEVGDVKITFGEVGFVTLQAYSAQDQLLAPQALLETLARFDGTRSTDDVLRDAKHHGIALTPWFVRRLVDYEVLVPKTSPVAG
jgi:hypothetical protein